MSKVSIKRTKDYRAAFAIDAETLPYDTPPKIDGRVWFIGTDTQTKDKVCFASYALVDDGMTALLDRSGVLKPYRGQGLQKRLIRARCADAKKQGATWAISFVASWNHASANSLISCGFRIYKPADETWAQEDDGCIYFRKQL